MKKIITVEESKWIGNLLGATWVHFTPEHLMAGLDAELELGKFNTAGIVTSKDLMITGKIALANLIKHSDYYDHPEKMKKKQNVYSVDASIDSIVDSPFTETYQSDYKENRRENRNSLLDETV